MQAHTSRGVLITMQLHIRHDMLICQYMAKTLEKFVPIRIKESTRTKINVLASKKKKHAYEIVEELLKV